MRSVIDFWFKVQGSMMQHDAEPRLAYRKHLQIGIAVVEDSIANFGDVTSARIRGEPPRVVMAY